MDQPFFAGNGSSDVMAGPTNRRLPGIRRRVTRHGPRSRRRRIGTPDSDRPGCANAMLVACRRSVWYATFMEESVDLSARAEREIRNAIIYGKFSFGEKLSDRALAASFGISRTPVREGLAALAREGLVVIRPQSGSFVMTLDEASVRALCEMRTILELGALRLVAGHPERLAIAVCRQIAGGALAVEAKNVALAEKMDSAFHKSLVHAADNPLLAQAYEAISYKLEAIRHRLPHDLQRVSRAVDQHRHIVDLTLTGRLDEAQQELAAHIQTVQQLAVLMTDPGKANTNPTTQLAGVA